MSVVDRRDFLRFMAMAGLWATGCQLQPLRSKESSASTDVMWFWNPDSLRHDRAGQAESALRGEAVVSALKRNDLLRSVVTKNSREASLEELSSFHKKEYIQEIQNWKTSDVFYRRDRWSPYSSKFAYAAAASAVGASIDLVSEVYSGRNSSGFATVRPPGHHALSGSPMGYCIFNNVAVAVRQLQAAHPDVRVAILDLDAHHGNGIQDAFYLDPNVLYVSLHQNEWPFTGSIEKTGQGRGRGTTVNIPLPPRTGDKGYHEVLQHVVEPALRRFAPEIIVVPMGFDTHWKDPQSFLEMTCSGQVQVLLKVREWARSLCQGKLALILEGGYQLEVLQDGVYNSFQVLRGASEYVDSYGEHPPHPDPDLQELMKAVKRAHGI